MEPTFEVLPPGQGPPTPKPKRTGLMGLLVALGVIAIKGFAVILFFFKTAVTMLASIWAYSLLFGWKFAAGIVILIFVHEMGHFVAAKYFGIPVSAPVFIPFMGAYVLLKNARLDPWTNAMISYAGPLAGGLGGWACLELATQLDSHWIMAVASATFILNAVNLLPIPPLDGSHIWVALFPKFTPGMKTSDRVYTGIFAVALVAGLTLGWLHAHAYLTAFLS